MPEESGSALDDNTFEFLGDSMLDCFSWFVGSDYAVYAC